jgi:hypothetical protein
LNDIPPCNHQYKMNDRHKRPLGITLLALPFLWIGCLGTLIFPILLLTGGVGQLSEAFLAQRIQSDGLRLAVATLLTLIWFGMYVLYGFIGLGLWRLRKWAWWAAVIVQWISIAMCIAAGAIIASTIAKQPLVAIPLAIGLMAPLAGILWYLYRPQVRIAFQLEVAAEVPLPVVAPTPTRKKIPVWIKVTSSVVVGFALFAGSIFWLVESMFRSSDIYALTLKDAQQAPCVISKLGTPVVAKGMTSGSMSESNSEGEADLQIPIRGPKGKAELQVSAKKISGSWQINSLVLDQGGDQTQLLPASGAVVCQ